MDSVESTREENRHLRRTMRDLVAISTLPAVWVGLDVEGIVRSLADVLLNTLFLDIVYVRLADPTRSEIIETIRSSRIHDQTHDDVIKASFHPLLSSINFDSPATIPDPFGTGLLNLAIIRFGVGAANGVLVAASCKSSFPTEQDRLLLGVGANQTAIVIQRRLAEEQSHQQTERLRVTLASIGDAVITTDLIGRITFLNSVAQSLTGWTQDNAAGQELDTVFKIINEYSRLPVESPVSKALREGRVVGLANHTILITKDGVERPIDDSAAPIRGTDGAIVGCILVFRDISEKYKAEAEVRKAGERARTILESITDAFFAVGQDWRFVYVNSQAERILNRKPGEMLGRVLWDELPGMVGSEFERAYRRVASEGIPLSVTSFYPDHGRWYEVHVYPTTGHIDLFSGRNCRETSSGPNPGKRRAVSRSVRING